MFPSHRHTLARALALIGVLAIQPAFSQPTGSPAQIADANGPIADLLNRVAALEAAAPTANVEGRTYCSVLDLVILRGLAINGTEVVQNSVIRRRATFSGGTLSAELLSHVRNTQLDNGVVTMTDEDSVDPLLASYTQSGTKLDITIPDNLLGQRFETMYVSKDGSMVHGTGLTWVGSTGQAGLTRGFIRNWTFIEGDTCDAEGQ